MSVLVVLGNLLILLLSSLYTFINTNGLLILDFCYLVNTTYLIIIKIKMYFYNLASISKLLSVNIKVDFCYLASTS